MNNNKNEIQPLTVSQLEDLQLLTVDDRYLIDVMLYKATDLNWRKVARIVGEVLLSDKTFPCEIPIRYCVDRLQFMIDQGGLESVGNILCIRHSEIRRLK